MLEYKVICLIDVRRFERELNAFSQKGYKVIQTAYSPEASGPTYYALLAREDKQWEE